MYIFFLILCNFLFFRFFCIKFFFWFRNVAILRLICNSLLHFFCEFIAFCNFYFIYKKSLIYKTIALFYKNIYKLFIQSFSNFCVDVSLNVYCFFRLRYFFGQTNRTTSYCRWWWCWFRFISLASIYSYWFFEVRKYGSS